MKLNSLQVKCAIVVGIAAAVGWLSSWQRTPAVLAHARAEAINVSQLRTLLTARYETAAKLLNLEEKRLGQGVTTLAHVCEVARWVRDSAAELPGTPTDRAQALSNYFALTTRLEASIDRAVEAGAASAADKQSAHYLRLDAEVTLARANLNQTGLSN